MADLADLLTVQNNTVNSSSGRRAFTFAVALPGNLATIALRILLR